MFQASEQLGVPDFKVNLLTASGYTGYTVTHSVGSQHDAQCSHYCHLQSSRSHFSHGKKVDGAAPGAHGTNPATSPIESTPTLWLIS